MECQSRLELERKAHRFKQETPTGWIEADPIVSSLPSEVKSVSPRSFPYTEAIRDQAATEQALTQTLLASGSVQTTLAHLAEQVGERLQAECCFIVLQEDGHSVSQIIDWHSNAAASLPSSLLLPILKDAKVRSTFTFNQPLIIPDWHTFIQSQNAARSRSAKRAGRWAHPQVSQIKAVLAVKTQFQGQTNGMIVLTQSQPYEWKESEVQLLESLSPHVAIAASQFHLEQQVQRQIRYQTLVNELMTAIRNNWELDRIFQLAVEGTAAALQVARGMILLLKYVDPLHRSRPTQQPPQARANIAAEWVAESLIPKLNSDVTQEHRSFWAAGCSLCQQILSATVEPIVLPACDISLEDEIKQRHWNGSIASAFHLDTLPALLLVPLENQGTVLGCLLFQHHQRLWSLEDITLVKLVAAQLSTAIIQSRTLQQIQAVVQERTAQLQRSLDVQAKLYEKTRQQVEQLQRLNQEREEFLSTISHELRTPLTSMTLAIRMLRQADLSPERRDKYLDILEQQCVQETQLINDLLALRKLETHSTTAQLQKLDIRYLIQSITQSVEADLAEKNLTLQLDLPIKPLTVYIESDSFSRILTELLANARKYSVADSKIQLQVVHESSSTVSQMVLRLRNIGSGILPDELPYIFDKFRRCQGVTQQAIQGTGLGLALVKGLVEHLGGTIAASSQPIVQSTSWQTCFTVTLPQCPEGVVQTIP